MANKKTRYTLTMSFYIQAKDDKEAIKIAKRIEAVQSKRFDNQATVDEIHCTPFASLNSRKVK